MEDSRLEPRPATARPVRSGSEHGRGLDADARAAVAGDLAAFERFHRATVARVHSLARRLLGAGSADDACQEVYLRAWRGLSSWRGEAGAGTWLHSLARNTLLNLAARGGARFDEVVPAHEPVARVRDTGQRLDLEAAIERLPRGARTVFVLHDVEGLEHGEIAARLSISVGTSKSQLSRARLLLRSALETPSGHGPPEHEGGHRHA